MKEFGLQIYSIRDQFVTTEGARNAFRLLKDLGYSYVQTAGNYPNIPTADLKTCADEAGIKIISTHFVWDKIWEDMETTFKFHETLGTNVIGVPSMPAWARNDLEGLNKFIDQFNELAKICAARGFRLTYHNHSFEFKKLPDGKTFYDHLLEKLDPSICFDVDVCWVYMGGIDIYDLLERLEGRVFMLHLKDILACKAVAFNADGKQLNHLPERIEVGCGNINFTRIIKAAEAVGCKYFVVEEEVYSTGNSLDSIRISAENIKAKFLEK